MPMPLSLLLPVALLAPLPVVPDAEPLTAALQVAITDTHVLIDSYPFLGLAGGLHVMPRPPRPGADGDRMDGPVWPLAERLMQRARADARALDTRVYGRVALFVDALTPIADISSTLYQLGQAEFGPFEAVVDTPRGRGRVGFGTWRWACAPSTAHPSEHGMLDWSKDPDDPLSGIELDLTIHGPPRPCHLVHVRLVDGAWQVISEERWVRDQCHEATFPADAPAWSALSAVGLPAGELCQRGDIEAQPDALWGTVIGAVSWFNAREVFSVQIQWWLDADGRPPSFERPKSPRGGASARVQGE